MQPDDRKFATTVVVGSALYPDAKERVYHRLSVLRHDFAAWTWIVVTSNGGVVDMAAQRAAISLGMILHVVAADFDAHEDQALAICNEMMLMEVGRKAPDRVIAFWDFQSATTRDMIRRSLLDQRHVEIWDADNEPAGANALETIFPQGVPNGVA